MIVLQHHSKHKNYILFQNIFFFFFFSLSLFSLSSPLSFISSLSLLSLVILSHLFKATMAEPTITKPSLHDSPLPDPSPQKFQQNPPPLNVASQQRIKYQGWVSCPLLSQRRIELPSGDYSPLSLVKGRGSIGFVVVDGVDLRVLPKLFKTLSFFYAFRN